jgi:hypothetical protein
MPVNGGRLRQPVGEAHLDDVSDAGLDRGSRDLAVEGPDPCRAARYEFPLAIARLELYPDYLPLGVRLRFFDRSLVRDLRIRGRTVDDGRVRGVAVACVGVPTVLVTAVLMMLGHVPLP